jgi:hypothetical protein
MDLIKIYKLRILSILSVLFLFFPFVRQCDNVEYANSNPICDGCEVSTDSQSLLSDIIFNLEDLGALLLLFSSLFSILLVLFSLFGLYKTFLDKFRNISNLYIINLILILLIMLINGYLFINRIGKIKIGFYLLLITNFYLFNHFRKLKIEK